MNILIFKFFFNIKLKKKKEKNIVEKDSEAPGLGKDIIALKPGLTILLI